MAHGCLGDEQLVGGTRETQVSPGSFKSLQGIQGGQSPHPLFSDYFFL
jgi:hypothetical protein